MASSRTAHPTFTTRSVLAFVTAATLVVAFAPPAMGTPRRGNEPRILRRRRLGAGDHRP